MGMTRSFPGKCRVSLYVSLPALELHRIACSIAPRDVKAGTLYAGAIVRAISGVRAEPENPQGPDAHGVAVLSARYAAQ
jgi:hypothetical protein